MSLILSSSPTEGDLSPYFVSHVRTETADAHQSLR
jgi:hypothetical protein